MMSCTHLIDVADLVHLVALTELFRAGDAAHPDGVVLGQARAEEDSATRAHLQGTIPPGLTHSERPVEIRLLLARVNNVNISLPKKKKIQD